MILNKTKIFAKVWKVTPSENGKYIDLQVSTSEKNEDESYTNSSWFPRAIGHAANALKDVKEGDRIEITSSKFTNERKKQDDETYKSFFRFIIFEAKIQGDGPDNAPAKAEKKDETVKPDDKADPF